MREGIGAGGVNRMIRERDRVLVAAEQVKLLVVVVVVVHHLVMTAVEEEVAVAERDYWC